jgi:Predicted membrane protein/domain
MTDPNDPQAEAPDPAEAATEPVAVAWTDPLPTQSRPGPAPGYVFVDIDPVTRQPLAPPGEILGATGAVFGALFAIFGLLALAHILYHVVLWSWRGGTLGQLALGIQVRRESDGRRIGVGTAVLRYVGYVISIWAVYIGLIWAAFDRRKQGWHDKIAGTLVIRRVD